MQTKIFFHFGSNLPKNVSNHYPELYPRKEKMLRIVFGTFYGRFEPNLSEIKPTLSKGQ